VAWEAWEVQYRTWVTRPRRPEIWMPYPPVFALIRGWGPYERRLWGFLGGALSCMPFAALTRPTHVFIFVWGERPPLEHLARHCLPQLDFEKYRVIEGEWVAEEEAERVFGLVSAELYVIFTFPPIREYAETLLVDEALSMLRGCIMMTGEVVPAGLYFYTAHLEVKEVISGFLDGLGIAYDEVEEREAIPARVALHPTEPFFVCEGEKERKIYAYYMPRSEVTKLIREAGLRSVGELFRAPRR